MSADTRTVDYDKLDFTRWLLASKPFQDWFIKQSPEITSETANIPSQTAKVYLDAIFAKESLARSAWTRWSKECLGVDLENLGNSEGAPIRLDAKGAEVLGMSRLEFAARSLVAREGGQLDRLTTSEMSIHINDLAKSIVQNISTLERYSVIQIDDKDGVGAKRGQFTIESDFWKVRASEAVNAALKPGLVLSRAVTGQDADTMQKVSWSTGSIYTQRNGLSDITVSEIYSGSAQGGGRLLGTHYLAGNTLLTVDAESFDTLKNEGEAKLFSETRETLSAFQSMAQSAVALSSKVQQVTASLGDDPLTSKSAGQDPSLK